VTLLGKEAKELVEPEVSELVEPEVSELVDEPQLAINKTALTANTKNLIPRISFSTITFKLQYLTLSPISQALILYNKYPRNFS
jgi:hypothetical protein|tara:strand:+ start:1788 stop:2039 length:252 start_codon:yes stop_codon:yes gene_type:complete